MSAVPTAEARNILKEVYTAQLLCAGRVVDGASQPAGAHEGTTPDAGDGAVPDGRTRGNPPGLHIDDQALFDAAALDLRSLIQNRPNALPEPLWDAVMSVRAPEPSVDLLVDSDPPNAQGYVNLQPVGITPHTLKVAPGLVRVEVEKEGYVKAFRFIKVGKFPARAVFRLVEKAKHRLALLENRLKILRQSTVENRPLTLSRLAQHARVRHLVLVDAEPAGKLTLRVFDGEDGELQGEPLMTRFDPTTGKVDLWAHPRADLTSRPSETSSDNPSIFGGPAASAAVSSVSTRQAAANAGASAPAPATKKTPSAPGETGPFPLGLAGQLSGFWPPALGFSC